MTDAKAESERDVREKQATRLEDHSVSGDRLIGSVFEAPVDAIERRPVEDRHLVSALLNTVGAMVVVLDRQGRIILFNRACERITDYSEEEVVGRRVWDLFLLPEEVPAVKAVFERLVSGEFPQEHENRWVTKAGDRRLIAWSNTSLHDAEGEVAYVVGTGIDITERRQGEQEIETLARFPSENPNPVLRVSESGILLYANRASSSLLDHWGCRVGYPLPDHCQASASEALRTGSRQDVEVSVGDQTLVLAFAPVVEHGYVNVYGLDITDRKRAQEQIRQQNEFLSSILESVTHPLYVVNVTDHTIQMANSAAYAGDLPDGATCYQLFHGLSVPCSEAGYACPLEEIRRTKESVTAEHVHREDDGSLRNVEVHGYPLLDDRGEVTAVIEYCLDITERKQMETALRVAKDAAEVARLEEQQRRQEAERRRQIAESLTDVLAALNSNQPLERILDAIAEQASQLLETEGVAICRLDRAQNALVVEATRCLSHYLYRGSDSPPGGEVLLEAVARREPAVVSDLTMDQPAEAPVGEASGAVDECDAYPFRAVLATPVVVQNEVYGGILLYHRHPRSFDAQEIELAAVFSDQVALAVENARLREQIQEAATTAERHRLARDLHDSVTQALFSASLVAETLSRVWDRDPGEAKQGLEELRDLTRGALAEMRTLLVELRPSALLEAKLDDLLLQLSKAVTSRAQLPVVTEIAPSPVLPPDVQVTFYRVAQEALNNAVKHAGAKRLTVSLQVAPPLSGQRGDGWQGQLVLCVGDDGKGFEVDRIPPAHLGLGIMRERAEAIGARLSVESRVHQGTDVTLVWEVRQP